MECGSIRRKPFCMISMDARGRMIKFVLVTRGRTGSTVVLDSLNNLDGVMALQEPFLSGVSAGSLLFPDSFSISALSSDFIAFNSPRGSLTDTF